MITWFSNLFKKKETLLVGVVRINYQSKMLWEYDWNPQTGVFRCYEDNRGKRTIEFSGTQSMADLDRLKALYWVGLLYDWKKHRSFIFCMPTYEDIKAGGEVWHLDA